jgi:hypothetical protein
MFFSEEKNQKTFVSALVRRYGIWPATVRLLLRRTGGRFKRLSFFGAGQAVKLPAMLTPAMPDE